MNETRLLQGRCFGAANAVDLVVSQLNRNETGGPAWPRMLLFPGRWVEPGGPYEAAVATTVASKRPKVVKGHGAKNGWGKAALLRVSLALRRSPAFPQRTVRTDRGGRVSTPTWGLPLR